MNSLPKLIDDKKGRTKELREFLGKEFPEDSLPGVEEARSLAAAHRHAMELFRSNEERAALEARRKERCEAFQQKQQGRRMALEQENKALGARQRQAGQHLAVRQKEGRTVLRQAHLQETKRIRLGRAAHRPKGLDAFRGRITGVELIIWKVHQHRDKKRNDVFIALKREVAERQQRETTALARRQKLQTLTMQRRLRALE